MNLNDAYYKHQQEEEAKAKAYIQQMIFESRLKDEVRQIARTEARQAAEEAISLYDTEIQIYVNSQSQRALEDALQRAFNGGK